MRRILVLLNRRASGGEVPVEEALAAMRDCGHDVDVRTPDDAEHLRFIIRAESPTVDGVVVGGGDGTVNAALAPVLERGVPLGILPMGTANDLARTLGIPVDLHEACAVIAARSTRAIDVAWADNRPFINAAGIGLSARISESLTVEDKRRLGPFSYAAAVIRTLRRHEPFRAEIAGQGGVRQVTSLHITVGNGVFYGGGTSLGEDAAIDDGRLDLYSVPPQSLPRMLRVVVAMALGRQNRLSDELDSARGGSFRISTQPPMTVSLDGEPLLKTPVHFRVAPRALHVFAPSASSGLIGERSISSARIGTGTARI